MAWMALLYVYLAVRVRQRQQIWAALAGLVSFTAIQFVVVLLQWRTGGVLGLSFLGVPTELGDRVTDSAVLGRPFGTIIHPVFLGAALGTVAVLAIALFVELRRPVLRALAAGVVVAALACIWLAQARAAFISVAVIGVVLIAIGVRRGRIGVRPLVRGAAAAGALGLVFLPQIIDKLSANFGTGHFFTEIRSRLEINEIAERMFQDSPFLGVGLNNFEVVLPAYERQPVIFFGHPVHNLYLLYLSETGLVGMIGFAVVGCSLVAGAWRLARSSDHLLRGVAMGALGVTGFFAVEELLGFALRQDAPLALFWIVAGLVAAGLRLASPADLVTSGEWGARRARALNVTPALVGGPAALRTGAPPVSVVRAWVPRRWVVRAALLTVGLLILVLAVPSGPAVAAMTPTTVAASGSMDSTPVVFSAVDRATGQHGVCLLYTSPSPRDRTRSRMPSSA